MSPPGDFSDLAIGAAFAGAPIKITAAMIDEFAALTGDCYAPHMDRAAAQAAGYPDRLAHGLLVLSLVEAQIQKPLRQVAPVALHWHWQFKAPVLCGDVITIGFEIRDKKRLEEPAREVLDCAVFVRGRAGLLQSGRCRMQWALAR
ncbi:MAG: MaoC family dehydratase [Mangrovicoccus sp.]|nr:MaoC family dehydratase [Mangrovicoccus sp.]